MTPADPGHIAHVRGWLKHNAERIAGVIEPPHPADRHSSGADFVRWVETLLAEYHGERQREYERTSYGHSRWTGD